MDKRNSRVAAAVASAGIEPSIKILDADAKTAVAAAAQLGCEVGAIANSLVFGGHCGLGDAADVPTAAGRHGRYRDAGSLVSEAYRAT